MLQKLYLPCLLLAAAALSGCEDHRLEPTPALGVRTLATGLVAPIGVETAPDGRIFVSESGTGSNDSRILLITPDGRKHPLVTGMPSALSAGGEPAGTDHLLYENGVLYALNILTGLYKINVDGFKPGDAAMAASSLTPERISTFVLAHPFVNNAHDSHPYNMCLGPEGAIYITDAGANAILRRAPDGTLSVLAEVPGTANPTSVGPPVVQSVPTGIVFDGGRFRITTLLGFPFPAGKAMIYEMDLAGKLTLQKQAFNSLVDLAPDGNNGLLVLEYALFGPTGWMPNTGRVVRVNAAGESILLDGLNQPTGLELYGTNTAYITSLADGTLLKVTY